MSEQELISILSSLAILYGILLLIAPIWIIALLQRHKLQNRTMICQLAEIRDLLSGIQPERYEAPAPPPAPEYIPERPQAIPTAGIYS